MFNFLTKPSYPAKSDTQLVEEIHKEFDTAADKLLIEANNIINSKNVDKDTLNTLSSLGFTKSKQFTEGSKVVQEQSVSAKICSVITNANQKYPLYKFITHDKVIELCKKYNLAFGITGNYTGDIPKKCIEQMKAYITNVNNPRNKYYYLDGFRTNYSDDKRIAILKSEMSRFRIYENQITKYDKKELSKSNIISEAGLAQLDNVYDINYSVRNDLMICAPISEMSVKDFKVTQHIPDPVVLAKCDGGYLIVTAWGIEASDPIVVNNKMN